MLRYLDYQEEKRLREELIVDAGGQCDCGESRMEFLTLSRSGTEVYCYNCLMIRKRQGREQPAFLKEFLKIYGSKCACCGENNPAALTIDHIDNDGQFDRMNHGEGTIIKKAVLEPNFSEYQILCWSCNRAKSLNDGVCPHQVKYI